MLPAILAKCYRNHAVVAWPVTVRVDTRPYGVTTVVTSSNKDQLVPLQYGGKAQQDTQKRNKLTGTVTPSGQIKFLETSVCHVTMDYCQWIGRPLGRPGCVQKVRIFGHQPSSIRNTDGRLLIRRQTETRTEDCWSEDRQAEHMAENGSTFTLFIRCEAWWTDPLERITI
jgi:hypothetical protein